MANDPNTLAYPPRPINPWAAATWSEQRLRRRLLEGTWYNDLLDALALEIESDRADMWGNPDMSKNVARDVWTQSSALYADEPATAHKDAPPATVEAFRDLLRGCEWRETMDAAQPMILAQREGVIRVDVVPVPGTDERVVQLQHVPADLVEVWPDPYAPGRVRKLAIYVLRGACGADGTPIAGMSEHDSLWTVEVFDLGTANTPPSYAIHTVSDANGNKADPVYDVTAHYAPAAANTYPWVHEGRPFIPAVLYHARRGLPRLMDPFYGIELVRGSLFASVGWTMWKHVYRDTSYPQRNVLDMEPAGGVRPSSRTPNAVSVTTDQSSILVWRSKGDKAGAFYQFQAGGDPIEIGNALENYCAGLVASYGISPADVQRVAADPRSGYAIALSREGIRKEIAKYSPAFAAGDRELLGVIARLWNLFGSDGVVYPVDGWSVAYRGLPKSPDEAKIEMERGKMRVDMGIASRVDLYVEHYGVTRKEAIKALERIAAENALVATFAAVASEVPEDPATDPEDPEDPTTDPLTRPTQTPRNDP